MTIVHYPDYLEGYSCKRGACRRTCCTCADWDIAMGREEFQTALQDPDAGELAEKLRAAGADGVDPVPLPCGPDGRCALLDAEGSCSWRARTSHDACSLCRDFPIMRVGVPGGVYETPSGACEAVLEELLAKPGKVEMRAKEVVGTSATPLALDARKAGEPYASYADYVRLGLDVLQDDGIDLDTRMAVLVRCLDVTSRMVGIGQGGRVGDAIASMLSPERRRAMAKGMCPRSGTRNPAARVCPELYLTCSGGKAYASLAGRVLENMGYEVVRSNPRARGRLVLHDPGAARARWQAVEGYLTEREGFLARVMVSVYLHNGVPLSGPDPWSSSRYFAVCYALLKFGMAGYLDEGSDDRELVDFLVAALRAFTHNASLYRDASRWLDSIGLKGVDDCIDMVLWKP